MTAVMKRETLDTLRTLGDPLLKDADMEEVKGALDKVGVYGLASSDDPDLGKLVTHFQEPDPIEPDGDRLVLAQKTFARYANEVSGALLLAALPQTYASGTGADVLMASGRLANDLRRRILGTAQFLMVVTQPAADADKAVAMWTPGLEGPPGTKVPPPWRMCAALRLNHEAIRQSLGDYLKDKDDHRVDMIRNLSDAAILNQEDLLGTLLTFSVTVFEVLEQFGIRWTTEEQDAYLHLWDLVGSHLGIGTPLVFKKLDKKDNPCNGRADGNLWQGLRPPSVADTRSLLDQIRAREWKSRVPGQIREGDWRGGRSGRLLVRALLDELNAAMPLRNKSWPVAVLRRLAPPVVADRLQLGAPGVVMGVLANLPGRRVSVGRFTAQEVPMPVDARITRMMANEVTRRATVRFIRQGSLVIPGLEEWSDGFWETRD